MIRIIYNIIYSLQSLTTILQKALIGEKVWEVNFLFLKVVREEASLLSLLSIIWLDSSIGRDLNPVQAWIVFSGFNFTIV